MMVDSTPDNLSFPSLQSAQDSSNIERPFIIEHLRRDVKPNGTFRPDARVQITQSLRTSGLLGELPSEDLKHLLLVFTFVSPNGFCQPSIQELAHALHLSEGKTRVRLERLTRFEWQGKPLLTLLARPSGMDAYAPASHLITVAEAAPQEPIAESVPVIRSRREEVIAYSREHYTRPRAEVERQIAELNGWSYPAAALAVRHGDAGGLPTDVPSGTATPLRYNLVRMGLTLDQADTILERFDEDRIRRQLEWLPYRKAKSPARLLLAAIEHDYGPPPTIRLQQAIEQLDMHGDQEGVEAPEAGGELSDVSTPAEDAA